MENTNNGWAIPAAQPAPLTPEERNALLSKWEVAKRALDIAKDEEMKLRKDVIAKVFNPKPGEKGTRTQDLANDYKLKCVLKVNYKLDNEEIDGTLDAIESMGAEAKLIAERIVKFKPELSVSEYNKLLEDAKHNEQRKQILDKINSVLTIEDASPSLEIVEPKGKK